jgi:DNA-binding MarR family transcriptional regulator
METRMKDYLETIAGTAIALRTDAAQANLPLFLRERYQLRRVRLFGQNCLLAIEMPGWETGSPAEYAAHAKTMLAQLSEPVTLVIPQVVSYARNRMVQAGTPFIVPGSQLFMPHLMVDLRERFSAPPPEAGLPLTPAAQAVLLFHLQRKPLHGMPLQEIANLTGYTSMTATKIKDEWETNGLCNTVRSGRSVVIEFPSHGRRLWHMAEQLLSSPVKKCEWVRWRNSKKFDIHRLAAGYTALSMSTMAEDDAVPTYAMTLKDYRKMLLNGDCQMVFDSHEADTRIEAWSYDPRLLSDGPSVDPLSLVLSLRGDSDDRVQQQLQTVLDEALTSSTLKS